MDQSHSIIHNPQPEEAGMSLLDDPWLVQDFLMNYATILLLSLRETNYIRFRPASKPVIKSLTRTIYNNNKKKKKIRSTGEKCVICLEEFKSGGRVATLPCGHKFDEECVVKWLETSHVCPLCRFKLPCEDQ